MFDSLINKVFVDCRLKGYWFELNFILVSYVVFYLNIDFLGIVYSYM